MLAIVPYNSIIDYGYICYVFEVVAQLQVDGEAGVGQHRPGHHRQSDDGGPGGPPMTIRIITMNDNNHLAAV